MSAVTISRQRVLTGIRDREPFRPASLSIFSEKTQRRRHGIRIRSFGISSRRVRLQNPCLGFTFFAMKVYLDTCSLQRPLDDKSQLRIRLEAEAILSVLDLAKAGRIELVSSDALLFEIRRNPLQARREFALETIAGFASHVDLTEEIRMRAETLNQAGIKTLDSLHLALAEAEDVDAFCTCDDSFLTKAKREATGGINVVSPLELAEELEKWESQ